MILDKTTKKIIKREYKKIQSLKNEIQELKEYASRSCIEEGYPSHGSNYELRVESWTSDLYENIDDCWDYINELLSPQPDDDYYDDYYNYDMVIE